jgi:hypothetical protein
MAELERIINWWKEADMTIFKVLPVIRLKRMKKASKSTIRVASVPADIRIFTAWANSSTKGHVVHPTIFSRVLVTNNASSG